MCKWCDHLLEQHHWQGYCKLCFCWGGDPLEGDPEAQAERDGARE